MNAVIYARYSSSGQREESIDGQLRECYSYAKKNNLNVIGEYTDKAKTGRSDKRPDFQRMLRDSERGLFEAVIVWKIDRFARNRYDSALYKHKLKKNGVQIHYAKESIPMGPEGIILESVMEGIAEYYSDNLSQNVKRGNYDSALELKTLGQTVLGLRKGADGRFEIDPATAPIVRKIFEDYAAGIKTKDICESLNKAGHRTSRGNSFNPSAIRRILENEKYIGVYAYKDLIRVEDGIPAIVDKDIFERVNMMLKKRHKSPAANRIDGGFLLTSKLFCGKCGELMTGDGGTSHTGRVYSYYICNNRRKHKCDKKRVNKDYIEKLVIDKLTTLIHSDEFVEHIADILIDYQDKHQNNTLLESLLSRKKENDKAIQNMIKAIESGIITSSTKTRLTELEAQGQQLEDQIVKERVRNSKITKDQIKFFFSRLREKDPNDAYYKIVLIDTFVNRIYLYDDNIKIVLNHSRNDNEVTLNDINQAFCEADESSSFKAFRAPNDAKLNFYNVRVTVINGMAVIKFDLA